MDLLDSNYYSREADLEYMSVSQFKEFFGSYGRLGCEFCAMEKLAGRWEEDKSTAMLVGSYVDSYFEGSLDRFKEENPQIFRRDGELKADYVKAEEIIARIERDRYFMQCMSGEKQVIMTGEIGGVRWKIKMDSYLPGSAIVDLKVVESITKLKWAKDVGYMNFIEYWGYDIQGAVYQEIVRQNTGKQLPFFIAAATKEKEPDIRVIKVDQVHLNNALNIVTANLPRILNVKSGEAEPDRCEVCDCCRRTRVLKGYISVDDLNVDI